MKISVCMAVYNGERYLKHQLLSILKQIGVDDEVYIVDDASSDLTLKIIELFCDDRIKLSINKENMGQQKSFEKALMNCTGNYIYFSDQDDIWMDDKVEKMQKIFLEMKCLAIVSDASVMDDVGNIHIDSFFRHRGSGPGVVKNFVQNTYLGCCMAIDARVKEWVLPFPAKITQHDEWIGLICEFMGGVHFLNEKLIHYRRHNSNASSMKRLPMTKVIRNRFNMLILVSIQYWKLLSERQKLNKSL
jgi:glycosyltransferase involved in cell wall biosynthesis